MSVAAEIVMQRLAARLARERGGGVVAVASERGVASPGIESVADAVRLAFTPVGGVRRRPAAVFAPPVDLAGAADDAADALRASPVMIDFAAARFGDAFARIAALSGRAPDAARLRGEGALPEGMTPVFEDREAGERIFVLDPALAAGAADGLDPGAAGFADEFDSLVIDPARGCFTGLRHESGGAEIALDPATALDLPDAFQIDAALGEGRVVSDGAGACSLVLPSLGRGTVGFRALVRIEGGGGIEASGLGVAALQVLPAVASGEWRIEGRFAGDAEAALIEIEARAPAAAFSIPSVHLRAARRRGAWEAWDEAEAQLALEESW